MTGLEVRSVYKPTVCIEEEVQLAAVGSLVTMRVVVTAMVGVLEAALVAVAQGLVEVAVVVAARLIQVAGLVAAEASFQLAP